ncbi:BZ3500_MvSof-1268-A1-R1_Chr4-3g07406 [Microbotryum saponariae]|uniref:BZ3500_MvSof-1268-A1-R1_Chr4-3g07406 protein n=1 Tax=Microbotryum saponariae TaxID=289078 RepID=A0A2X0LFS9_9BASI|nr:BZ3500_MvSof-1268-A1-R1_Chr4-3g07406 [Microbotryum saponariae]SDA07069.1 BZ3501_MvSof-1269-A2-R1_Chr4-2g07115 [Microbotryum saponariae]
MSLGQDTQQVATGSTRIAASAANTPAQAAPRRDLADDDSEANDDRGVLAHGGQSRPGLGLGDPSTAATSPSPIPITRSLRRSSRRIPSATHATHQRDTSTAARAQDGPLESYSPSREPHASTSISSSFISPSSFESARHPWHDAKYRDTIERAQNKGDPSSWGVLHAAMATSGYGGGPAPAGTSGGPPEPPLPAARESTLGERDRTSARSQSNSRSRSKSSRQNVVKTASQSSLVWLSSAFSRHDTSLSSAAERDAVVLTEEPHSYAQVRPDHDEHGNGQDPDPTPKSESALLSSPRREPRRQDHPASQDEDSDTDYDGPDRDRPRGRSRRRLRRSRSAVHSSSSSSTTSEHHENFIKRVYSKLLPLSTLQKNITKCVLAYFIAELFTFVPFLTEWLGSPWDVDGPVRNAHVVATVAVYFYPARTIGSMFEADCFMFLGAMYATFLCCGSMAMSVWLDSLGHEQLAHAVVLIFWLGGGYTILAYAKTSVNKKPSFTTACSMVSLITSVIITKEGAFHIGRFQSQAILQVLLIVACGSGISNAVCFLLWPMSATSKLQGDLNKTLASFSTLLDMLTKTFLLDDDITTRPVDLVRAVDQHQASFTTLKSSLAQAKFETFDARMSATTASYDEVVRIMTRLAQGLTGMRAGCTLQYDLIKARADGILVFGKDTREASSPEAEEAKGLMEELVVFEKFKERVGPSLKTLSSLSRSALSLLRTSFVQTKAGSATREAIRSDDPETGAHLLSADDLLALKQELDSSLVLFEREHSRAIKILYRSLPAQTIYGPGELQKQQDEETPFIRERVGGPENDEEEGPNESLFRVYHYCFNVEEWAKELSQLIEIFVEIRTTEEIVERKAIERRRRWGPLAGVAACLSKVETSTRSRPKRRGRRSEVAESTSSRSRRWYSWLATLSDPGNGPFPVIVDGALSSHQFPSSQLSRFGAFKQRLWIIGYRLRQPSVKFAIKTGAGAALLASAAFVPQLRPVWIRWRGEWALISYMVIMAPVVGGTNFLAFGRVLGTLAGGVLAVLCYVSFPENAIALPLLGALVSVPCFYVIVTRPQFGPSSRFVLLTFNLTCLYAFNLREADTHPGSIAFHRTVAVSVGVVYALIVNTYVWPFEARRELRKGLSDFFLNSAYLYERIVRTYSVPPPALTARANHSHLHPISDGTVDERTSLISTDAQEQLEVNENEFVAMEVHLQLSLIKLQGLLSATSHEPRLKGPFPIAPYQTILSSCQTILDLLTSIQQVTNREAWFTTVRRDFVIPANPERREMVGNVLLYFSLLASASTLKTPMPPFLPPAKEAREHLVKRLRSLPVVKRRLVRGGSEGLLYLGYALTMKDVIAQLDLLGATYQSLFGIIGGATSTASFEALFTDEPVDSESRRDDSSDEETPNPV